jgi:hypothetical protein
LRVRCEQGRAWFYPCFVMRLQPTYAVCFCISASSSCASFAL